MIITKIQLIQEFYRGYELKSKAVKICIRKLRTMPEIDFINFVKSELNLYLEPIRKNQYICS